MEYRESKTKGDQGLEIFHDFTFLRKMDTTFDP